MIVGIRTTAQALALALFAVTVAGGIAFAQQQKNPQPQSAQSVAAGRYLYMKWCQACHGADGKGAATIGYLQPAPDLTDDTWLHGGTDGDIFDTIRNGSPPNYNMEPWADRLKETEVWDLVNFIRTLRTG